MRSKGTVEVVDAASHQDAFVAICGPRTPEGHDVRILAQLVPEPANPHDANAIAVFALGQRVGYLSPEDAKSLGGTVARTISKRTVATCHAVIRGGWDRGAHDQGPFAITLFDASAG